MKKLSTLMTATALAVGLLTVQVTDVRAEQERGTMLEAVSALANQEFAAAYNQFRKFLDLGSPDAAYNLGLLAIEGAGTEYDPVKSLAFFKAAELWGHPGAAAIAAQIEPHLNAEELTEVSAQVAQLQAAVIVPFDAEQWPRRDFQLPAPTRRNAPDYPAQAARQGIQSWLDLLQITAPNGRVITSVPVNTVHPGIFRSFKRTEGSWRFERGEQVLVRAVRLTFSLDDETQFVQDMKNEYVRVLPLATAGIAQNQFFLANLAALAQDNNYDAPELRSVDVQMWLERAARGGHVQAQRYLAMRYGRKEWADHLIARDDLITQTYYGMQMYTYGGTAEVRAEGERLVRDASSRGEAHAREIIRHL